MTVASVEHERELIARGIRDKGERWKAREMTVALREADEGEDGDQRIPVVLSSEAEVGRWDWWNGDEYVEILDHASVDLGYARDGMPFCLDHWTSKQIGLVEDVRVVGKELHGLVRFGHHPDAEWVERDIRAGIRKKVSIGYEQLSYTVVGKVEKGKPERRRYAFRVLEGSSVAIPADYEVGFGRSYLRALRAPDQSPESTAREGEERQMSGNATADAPTIGAEALEAARNEARAQETERVANIRELVTLTDGAFSTEDAIDAIATGKSYSEARGIAKEKREKRQDDEPAVRTASAPDVFVRSPKGAIGRDGKVKESAETFGFDSPGEFFQAVRGARRGEMDARFTRANEMFRGATGQSGVIDSDGGFAVPPQFMTEIIEPVYTESPILSQVDRLPISGTSLEQNLVDETSRTKGNRWGGVSHSWGGETDAADSVSKVKLRRHRWSLNALNLKGAVTDDELEDAPALGDTLTKALRAEAIFAAGDVVFNGTGLGQPLGILASDALVTVAIEGSQTVANTSTYIAANTTKMLARMPSELEAGAAWYSHRDVRAKLMLATIGGTSAVTGLYVAPGMMAATPRGGIWGLPHYITEFNAAEGTVGDFVLANLKAYRWVERTGLPGIKTSGHVRFWENEQVFKLRWRVDGGPTWRAAVTPAKGANKISPFIALGTRS